MLILTNCLTTIVDEGCLKVANSLIKRIKKAKKSTVVVTYEHNHPLSDHHFELNKFMMDANLKKTIQKYNDSVLYIPFPARTFATSLRIFVLSRFCKHKLNVVMAMKEHFSLISRLLLKLSKAEMIVFSKDAHELYSSFINRDKITYVKTGVDINKFVPINEDVQKELKKKYGFSVDKPVILHVGHLNKGRGVDELIKIRPEKQVVLVCSTLTKDEQDKELKNQLLDCGNIRIMEEYLPHIEELYQLCDAYFFPTQKVGKCIDVPLSCLEAAACNKPVISTDFGELKEFKGKTGFYYIDSFEENRLNELIETALKDENPNIRQAVLPYDWNNALEFIMNK